jgi:hypothetical protein
VWNGDELPDQVEDHGTSQSAPHRARGKGERSK